MKKRNKVIVKKEGQIIETSFFDDFDDAYFYRVELIMRQNYGEKQLDGCDFSLVTNEN